MIRKHLLVILSLLAVVIFGCKKTEIDKTSDKQTKKEPLTDVPRGLTKEQAAKVVAKVGDSTITVGDLTQRINSLSPYIRRRWSAPEKRKKFLEKLIKVELLSQEAIRIGLDKDPKIKNSLKQVMIRLMIKNDLEKNYLPSSVDIETLKKKYKDDYNKYHRPPQVRAAQIVTKTEDEAKKLINEINENKDNKHFFIQKAKEISIDNKTRISGGDMGYFCEHENARDDEPKYPQNVVKTAWALKKGDITTKPVKSDIGYHVIKRIGERPEMHRSFDSVKLLLEKRILRELREEKMDKFVAGLKKKAKIEIFEDNIKNVKVTFENRAHAHAKEQHVH